MQNKIVMRKGWGAMPHPFDKGEKMKKRIVSIIVLLTLVLFVACRKKKDDTLVRVAGLKGPTSIGLAGLINDAKTGKTVNQYAEFTMAANADEIVAKFLSGELDIILIPANVASVLYNKTNGTICVLDINTLGVLYMVSADTNIKEVSDLKGKTIYLTGKGTTPDYVLQYLLTENGIALADVTLEYKSEATEVAAVLSENSEAVGLLPQPFVTAACAKNESLSVVIDTTAEWKKIQGENGGELVTGVTVARTDFVKEHKEVVEQFIKEHKASAERVSTDLDSIAGFVVELGIIANEGMAKKAIPQCNIVCMTGEEMKKSLSSYLAVLYNAAAASVGGNLPNDDFYYAN